MGRVPGAGLRQTKGTRHRPRQHDAVAARPRRAGPGRAAGSFDAAAAPALHVTQYFEMMGHRSLYHDGWRAVCPWPGTSFTESGLA
ncbi:MAG TPA: hypothetical protein VH482_03935, partial [Thermomicrobiales bacterium]